LSFSFVVLLQPRWALLFPQVGWQTHGRRLRQGFARPNLTGKFLPAAAWYGAVEKLEALPMLFASPIILHDD